MLYSDASTMNVMSQIGCTKLPLIAYKYNGVIGYISNTATNLVLDQDSIIGANKQVQFANVYTIGQSIQTPIFNSSSVATYSISAPTQATNLAVDSSTNLSFTDPSNFGGTQFVNYGVYLDGTLLTTSLSKPINLATSLSNLPSIAIGSHTLTVKVTTLAGTSVSSGLSFTYSAISAPTGFTSSGHVVSWSAPVSGAFVFGSSSYTQVASYRVTLAGNTTSTTSTSFDVGFAAGSVTVAVAAVDIYGNVGTSASYSFTPSGYPPAAPSGLSIIAGSSGFDLKWTAPANNGSIITGYNLYLNGNSTPIVKNIQALSGPLPNYLTTLTSGNNTIQVSAVNQVGESTKSSALTFTANAPTALAVSGAYYTPGSNRITFSSPSSWGSLVYQGVTYNLPAYLFQIQDSDFTSTTSASSFDPYAPQNTNASIQVSCLGKYGLISQSTVFGLDNPNFGPSTPVNAAINSSFVLTWSAPENEPEYANQYLNGGMYPAGPANYKITIPDLDVYVSIPAAQAFSYDLYTNVISTKSLIPYKTYTVIMASSMSGYTSGSVNLTFQWIPPSIPTSVKLSTSNVLSWSAPATAGTLVSGSSVKTLASTYDIYANGAVVHNSSSSPYTITYPAGASGHSIPVNICVKNVVGSGPLFTNSIADATSFLQAVFSGPSAPTNVAINSTFRVTWTAASSSTTILGYNIYVNGTLVGTGSSPYSLINAKNYFVVGTNSVTVAAYDSVGSGLLSSAASFTIASAGTFDIAGTNPGVSVSWSAPSAGTASWTTGSTPYTLSLPVIKYTVAVDDASAVDNSTSTSLSLTSVSKGYHTINVLAYITTTISTQSSFLLTNGTVPDAPTNVVATLVTNDSVSLTWTVPSSNGGSDITGYSITSFPYTQTYTSSTNSFTFPSVPDGVDVTFYVSATNLFGTGSAGSSSPVVTSSNFALSVFTIDGVDATGGSITLPFVTSTPTIVVTPSNSLATITSVTAENVAHTFSYTDSAGLSQSVIVNSGSVAVTDNGSGSYSLASCADGVVVSVLVTAQDNTTYTYVATISKAQPLSSVARLNTFTINGTDVTRTVSFPVSATTTSVQMSIIPAFNGTYTMTLRNAAATLDGSGNLNNIIPGSNMLVVIVTSSDGSFTNSYSLTISAADTDASLSVFTIGGVDATTGSVTLPYGSTSVTMVITPTSQSATITSMLAYVDVTPKIPKIPVNNNNGTYTLPVADGEVVRFTVRAGNGTTRTYTTNVSVAAQADTGGDPYVTTFSGIQYKLPVIDAPVRYFQDIVDGSLLTVNVQLKTVNSNELSIHNFRSLLGLKNKMTKNQFGNMMVALQQSETLSFCEKVHIQYGNETLVVNLFDSKFDVLREEGAWKARSSFMKTDHLLQKTGVYGKYSSNTIKLTFGSTAVLLSLYSSPMIRNGISVEASPSKNANGVLVNALSERDMCLKSLESTDSVPQRNSLKKRVIKETFADHDGLRERNIVTYK